MSQTSSSSSSSSSSSPSSLSISSIAILQTPFPSPTLPLSHRIVLAPMTRMRADNNTLLPNPSAKAYYAERTSPASLLIFEGIVIDPRGKGFPLEGAGFDGVEIHGWNRYLVDSFTHDSINTRGDEYGGSISNRIRFALEVVDAVVCAVGRHRTVIRLAPYHVATGHE